MRMNVQQFDFLFGLLERRRQSLPPALRLAAVIYTVNNYIPTVNINKSQIININIFL